MASGIEIAGLTLAVFPLVVSGLKAYADGVKTMGDLWRYKITLKSLVRELRMEKCKFENTCASLLEEIVAPPELKFLMGALGEASWGDEDLQEKLKARLGPDGEQCFIEAVQALQLTLQALQDDFKLVKTDKLLQPESTNREALKRQWKEIRLVLSKQEHKEKLASITKINSDLVTLTGQSKLSKLADPSKLTTTTKHYTRIRDHSKNLYRVLKENLHVAPACTCTAPHNASLGLEVRDRSTSAKESCNWDTNLQFHVVLSFGGEPIREASLQRNWREMKLEPLDSGEEPGNSGGLEDKYTHINTVPFSLSVEEASHTSSYPIVDHISRPNFRQRGHSEPSNIDRLTKPTKASFNLSLSPNRGNKPRKIRPKVSFDITQEDCTHSAPAAPTTIPKVMAEKIHDLCGAIQQADCRSCLGVLIDQSNRQYRVWPIEAPSSTSEPTGAVSLESLLAQPEALTTKDRLILGVQLASTVMQLHATEWLSENWSKRDIFFIPPIIQGGAANISRVIRKPFVCGNFVPPQAMEASAKSNLVLHDQSLFSLGLILIELWYNRHLEDLQIKTDVIEGAADMTDFVTARRLVDKIYDDAGEKYGAVARRCIMGLDRRDQNLTTDSFKEEVHTKVVCPLVENLEAFFPMWRQELV